MTKRPHDDALSGDVARQLQPLVDDDAFLTELSLGKDPSGGADELAALFLELRDDVERPMPPAPVIEGADEQPAVISLDTARRRRRSRPLVSGLIGAAAATLLIAGAGTAVYNAGPNSPLYGANQAMFGKDDPDVVQLAGTLDEMESRAAEGDMAGARELLDEARKLMRKIDAAKADSGASADSQERTVTVTTTAVPKPETVTVADQPAPAPPTTVTERLTETVVSTVVVPDGGVDNPLPEPTETPVPEAPGEGAPVGPDNPGIAPPQLQQ